jgi:hypothetical protein
MIERLLTLLSFTGVAACSSPGEYCIFAESPQHRSSLLREFAVDGITAAPGADNALCVDGNLWLEADRVRARVESYRRDVAVMVTSAEQKERVIAMLRREGKEFTVSAPSDRGELIVVLSGSAEEAARNRALVEALE